MKEYHLLSKTIKNFYKRLKDLLSNKMIKI